MRRLTIIESPFAGADEATVYRNIRNIRYARACVADSVRRGEAPIASHLLFTQPGLLDDTKPEERALGIAAGLEWYRAAELCAVYTDLGISSGMQAGIERAGKMSVKVEKRQLEGWA